jgi:hypothetical protein
MDSKPPTKVEIPVSPVKGSREIDIRAMEEREREGYGRKPQSNEEAKFWERVAVWPPK